MEKYWLLVASTACWPIKWAPRSDASKYASLTPKPLVAVMALLCVPRSCALQKESPAARRHSASRVSRSHGSTRTVPGRQTRAQIWVLSHQYASSHVVLAGIITCVARSASKLRGIARAGSASKR